MGGVPLTERLLTWSHRLVTGGLFAATVGGLAFVGYGLTDIWTKAKARQRLAQESAASSEGGGSTATGSSS